ncbi:MAG TPA: HAMP domain-containing sensor histidine kinase [bacterium]|nr:HAMP domain-containing sensor histidine kinase [bacterium]
MKRLRVQFVLFFVLLAGSLGFLVWNSYRQLAREEHELWRAQAEKVYNQMQAAVSDFLTAEDARRWSDYRYYGTLTPDKFPKQPVGFSPLSKVPEADPRGLVGYFQINPDDVFSTPYLPESWPDELDSLVYKGAPRRLLFKKMEEITSSLRVSKDTKAKTLANQGYVELGEIGKIARAETKDGLLGKDDLARDEAKALDGFRAKNVYPNPVQEQAIQLEMRKGAASKSAAKTEKFAAKKEAAEDSQAPDFENYEHVGDAPAAPPPPSVAPTTPSVATAAGAAAPEPAKPAAVSEFPKGGRKADGFDRLEKPAEKAPAPERAAPPKPPRVLSDPFQARLVDQTYLLFYRKVWVDQRQYLQGFAVDLETFYSWLMDRSFANSELPEFALARLELSRQPVAQYGIIQLPLDGLQPLFERALGYPLNLFDWSVYAERLPRIGTRWFLNTLSIAVGLLATIGLFLIYRSAAAQVTFSQKRQDFVSAVTHELKTPLTSIRMYSEMLEDDWAKEESKRKEYYRQISKESGRLSRMIENVLQLARLEKKTYKLNLKKAVPTADFAEICEELKKIADRQGFVLAWKEDSDLPPLTYDPEAVKQILMTLLDNSLKFATESPDKTLEAELRREGDRVIWAWRDRGPGIPQSALKKVFENFYRVENEMTRKTQGTGIGLAMSRMLAESMGAVIEARNRPDGGLEVLLTFPAV